MTPATPSSEFGSSAVLDALVREQVMDEGAVVRLLGPDGRSISLPELEQRLVAHGVLSEHRLALAKGAASGYPVVVEGTTGLPVLTERVARSCGAVVLDEPAAAVGFVEPNSSNVTMVQEALQGRPFAVKVMTLAHFQDLLRGTYAGEPAGAALRELPDMATALTECIRRRGTDLHIQVGRPPVLRLSGRLEPLEYRPVDAEWLHREVRSMMSTHEWNSLEQTRSHDFAYQYGTDRFRVNVAHDSAGLTVAARLLASTIPSMDDLGLPPAVRAFTELERGLVLVTGPTGSGKSTTLASVLDHIARNQSRHVITLEDPIEYVLTAGRSSVVNQRELSRDFLEFPEALRDALRQDPDVILVGEMRDPETARTAVTAAETGHLVFSTLHTMDAMSSVARLVSMYPEGEQDHAREKLAYILKGVVSQTLVPRSTTAGRVAAMEIMLSSAAITNNLRQPNGLTHLRSTMQTSRREGMQTMEMSLATLVLRGLVRVEEAEFRARDREELHRYLAAMDDV